MVPVTAAFTEMTTPVPTGVVGLTFELLKVAERTVSWPVGAAAATPGRTMAATEATPTRDSERRAIVFKVNVFI
jgi:hypothetical protein